MKSKLLQLSLLLALAAVMTAQTCPDGRYRDPSSLCLPCSSTCATCESATYCTSCVANHFLVAGNNSVVCTPCSTVLLGCSQCLTNVACRTCAVGYTLKDGSCFTCATSIANCSTCSSDGLTCNTCRYPYVLSNNSCISSTVQNIVAGVPTVFVTNPDGTQAPKVQLDSGLLVAATIDPNGCNQYQVFYNGKCIRAIFQCLVYQDNGLCQICGNTWKRTIFGDCGVQNYVLQCEDGFWHDSASDSCKPVFVGCDWYFPNNGSCLNCSANYTFTNGTCVPNRNCTDREFFRSGVCVSVPLACLTFLSNGTCTACAAGNTLAAGECTPSVVTIRAFNDCVLPCATCFFAQLSYCFSCRSGY
jgi:hypothetical protein